MTYNFVAGQIKVLESKLLTQEQLDRMIGAPSAKEAFGVLVELQYAEYIQEETRISDFDSILDQGLLETKQKILKGTESHPLFDYLWLGFDLNNLKRALKLKYLESHKSFEDFTPENGFSSLGTLDKSEIKALIFQGQSLEKCPPLIWDVLREAETILESGKQDFLVLEGKLDQALFETQQALAKMHANQFLLDVLDFQVAQKNVLAVARSLFIREVPLSQSGWIKQENLDYKGIAEISDMASYAKWLSKTPFWSLKEAFELEFDPQSPEIGLIFLERALDKKYFEFLENSVLGKLNDLEVPFVYFEKRIKNAKILKIILLAKLKGMESKTIYSLLNRFFIT